MCVFLTITLLGLCAMNGRWQELHAGGAREDDEFDEDEHGQIVKKTSVAQAVFSYLCTCVGAGVLSLPGALQYSGWCGLILMAFVAIACNHTAKLLCACMFARPGVMLRTYEDIGEQALGKNGRKLVAFFQVITLFGVCTIFLILIGGNMNTIVPKLSLHDWSATHHTQPTQQPSKATHARRLLCSLLLVHLLFVVASCRIFIFAALLIPIAWLKTMNEVSYLAVFGVLASLYVAGIVVVKGFLRCASGPEEGAPALQYDVINANGLSNAVNIIVFSFGGHSVLPNIVSHVKSPQKNFKAVAGYSYFLIAAIYIITAAGRNTQTNKTNKQRTHKQSVGRRNRTLTHRF